MKLYFFILYLFLFSFFSNATKAREESITIIKSGLLKTLIYSPASLSSHSSTILALPGCTQSAQDFFELTHLKKYADQYGAIVIVPEQSLIKNPAKCWNWYSSRATKNKAETKKIMNLVKEIQQKNELDSTKTFVLGFSAGAAMANVIASCYINDIRAVAVHDGAHYKALSLLHPIRFLKNGSSFEMDKVVEKAFKCNETRPAKKVGAIILQAGDVKFMSPSFAHSTFSFYQKLNHKIDSSLALADIIESKNDDLPYPIRQKSLIMENTYLIEEYIIENLKHAWSGGKAGYRFSNSQSIDASELIFNFFNQYNL